MIPVVADFELSVPFFGFDIYGPCWNIKSILNKYFITTFYKQVKQIANITQYVNAKFEKKPQTE